MLEAAPNIFTIPEEVKDIHNWKYEELTEAIIDTAIAINEPNNNKQLPWFTLSEDLLLEKIQDRNNILNRFKWDKSPQIKKRLQQARKKLSLAKVEAKNKWLEMKCNNIEKMQKSDPRQAWQNIKDLAKGLFGHHNNKKIKN